MAEQFYPVKLVEIRTETPEMKTFRWVFLEERFKHEAGQFLRISLPKEPGLEKEVRPFTIASSPTQDYLEIATKRKGAFTSRMDDWTSPGIIAQVQGPRGRFTLVKDESQPLLFLAAGSGVTPLMSMARYIHDRDLKHPLLFIHSDRTPEDLCFRKELLRIAERSKNIRILFALSGSGPFEGWKGLHGRIDLDLVRKHAPDFKERMVCVCGPPPMIKALREGLKAEGLQNEQIRYEFFGKFE